MTHIPSIFRVPDDAKLEAALRVPSGFLAELGEEDDWSFIVKSHALLEASLSELLAHKGDPRLNDFFRRLPFDGGRSGKLKVARDLRLIDEQVAHFLSIFSKLRNTLVHDVRLVRFRLAEYVSQLDQAELRRTADAFGGVLEELRGSQAAEARRAFTELHLRPLLHFAVLVSIAQMHFAIHPDDLAEIEARWDRGDQPQWAIAVLAIVLIAAATQFKDKATPPSV